MRKSVYNNNKGSNLGKVDELMRIVEYSTVSDETLKKEDLLEISELLGRYKEMISAIHNSNNMSLGKDSALDHTLTGKERIAESKRAEYK